MDIGREFHLVLVARTAKTSEDDLLDIRDTAGGLAGSREHADVAAQRTTMTPPSGHHHRQTGRAHTGDQRHDLGSALAQSSSVFVVVAVTTPVRTARCSSTAYRRSTFKTWAVSAPTWAGV